MINSLNRCIEEEIRQIKHADDNKASLSVVAHELDDVFCNYA